MLTDPVEARVRTFDKLRPHGVRVAFAVSGWLASVAGAIQTPARRLRTDGVCPRTESEKESAAERAKRAIHCALSLLDLLLIDPQVAGGQRLVCGFEGGFSLA
jgi:hypothetical protein